MTVEAARAALRQFALTARADRRANAAARADGTALELLLAPRFQRLVETLLPLRIGDPPAVLPEYRRPSIGRPDLAFARAGQPARAFIELKEPGKTLDPRRWRGHDADQWKRFQELPLWALCNFHTLVPYRRNESGAPVAVVPAPALDPETSDAAADRQINRIDPAPLLDALETLALAPAAIMRSAEAMAAALAQAARLVRRIVVDQCRAGAPAALDAVRSEFRDTLFAHAAAGGFDLTDENDLFAIAFAQTLAFGIMLARDAASAQERREAADKNRPEKPILVDRYAYQLLPAGAYPLLRSTLRALTEDEVLDVLGVSFDIVRDTVNAADPMLLVPSAGRDPILYFYEDFLETFDPAARRKHGVFFTPVPVVRFMVAATDRALRDDLGTNGLLDDKVLLLDPACGTGTFLVAAAAHAKERVRATWGDGAVAAEMAALAGRLHGLEMLVGPYTVAHYRMLREVGSGAVRDRLPIYLADTLRPPTGAVGVTSRLGYMAEPIREERRRADELKRDTPVLAIIGNPPYRRLAAGEEAALVSGWGNGFWDDLKEPVRRAGWGGELNTFPELSVAFWRWCLWKLFESDGAPGRGVVCLITNRTFLAGHPYAGLRQMLRRRFDTIDIIDLRGDSQGALPATVDADENIFNIQVGVCVLIAVATGEPRPENREATVRYADSWRQAAFTRDAKLALLGGDAEGIGSLASVPVNRRDLSDFVPTPFACSEWPALREVFSFSKSGVKTQRDGLVYGLTFSQVESQLTQFLGQSGTQAWLRYYPESSEEEAARVLDPQATLSSVGRRKLRAFLRSRAETFSGATVSHRAYRPFDRRFLYADRNFVSRHGPELAAAWGERNLCLYAMPSGTGAGPAVWVHGSLPDYHAFSGRGGYALPLWDRRQPGEAANLAPALLPALSTTYGWQVQPQEAFDAIAALLSATSYTRRFAWDLEEALAHVPFPADPAVFADAARIGADIRALETFAREPGRTFRSARLAGAAAAGAALAAGAFRVEGGGAGVVPLLPDQSLRLVSLPERVYTFAVSGYRVLPRWLEARQGEPIDSALQRAITDVAWRIEELLHWFDAADAVLARALAGTLTRASLHMRPAEPSGRALDEAEEQ